MDCLFGTNLGAGVLDGAEEQGKEEGGEERREGDAE